LFHLFVLLLASIDFFLKMLLRIIDLCVQIFEAICSEILKSLKFFMVWAEFPFELQLVVVKSIEFLINFLSLFFYQGAQFFIQFIPLRANKLNQNFFGLHFTDESRQLGNLCFYFSAIHFYFLLNLHNILINTLP
jgi:hypothetical protein